MNISKYISQLLYSNNCVVISGFGGFVCQEFSSEMNEATQMFLPPSKKVSFQLALQDSNFDLEQLIALQEGVSVEEAKNKVADEVRVWRHDLSEGKHVKLDGVGRVYLDNNQEIAFQADLSANFDADAFGLGIFRFPVLKEEETIDSVHKTVIASVKNSSVSKIWQRAAVVAAVVGLFYIGSQKGDFQSFEMASINPMRFSKVLVEENQVEPMVEEIANIETVEESSVFGAIDTEVQELPDLYETINQENFYIIVGAFKVRENASAFLNNLRNQGFENAQYFSEKGFYKVSVDHFSTKVEAVNSIDSIKRKIQNGAWIYRK